MHAARARALYRACMKTIPAYVRSPGVKQFLEAELSKEVLKTDGFTHTDLKQFKAMCTQEVLEEAAKADVTNSFRSLAHLRTESDIVEAITAGEKDLEKIRQHIIAGRRGFKLEEEDKFGKLGPKDE